MVHHGAMREARTSAARTLWSSALERHGWRAVAVPVLSVVTLAALVWHPGTDPADAATRTALAASAGEHHSPETLSAPQTLAPQPAALDGTACAGNAAAQLFLVDITLQHAWACDGPKLVLSTPVTTGADRPDRETHVGTWQIQDKQTDRDLVGPGYSEFVRYWMPYDGDFGLHDASWQTFTFGGDQWRTDGSHGCVHLPTDAMGFVFHWAQVGATVTIEA